MMIETGITFFARWDAAAAELHWTRSAPRKLRLVEIRAVDAGTLIVSCIEPVQARAPL
jgi:hypothetical protein